MNGRKILVTEPDMAKLDRLLHADSPSKDLLQAVELLEKEVQSAKVVAPERIPDDVVTMNSRVRVRQVDTEREVVFTLVFPEDADIERNMISVLAPIGTAMLGHRQGQTITVRAPGGARKLRIEEIVYQPEARGSAVRAARISPPGRRREERRQQPCFAA